MRILLVISPIFILIISFLYFVKFYPKSELCKVYYPEISAYSCLMSDYGLPSPSKVSK